MKLLRIYVLSVCFLTAFATPQITPQPIDQKIQRYIHELHQNYQFDEAYLASVFQKSHFNHNIITKMNHPYEEKPWPHYRKIFITQKRIRQGIDFWHKHQALLTEAQTQYGVPASVILAILGIETLYGKHKGNFPVLDSLTTLAFHYPKRARFFKNELTDYLLMTREQHLSPDRLTGSYAGAMGMPQFMPSTYRDYAVDYSKQGSADLANEANDAIFSIANYLNKMGWQPGHPIAQQITNQKISRRLISKTALPKHKISYFQERGVKVALKSELPVAIVQLPMGNHSKPQNWLTFANFKAIMRYNPRINYAMAVYQLNEAIKNEYRRTLIAASTKPSSKRAAKPSARNLPKVAQKRPG